MPFGRNHRSYPGPSSWMANPLVKKLAELAVSSGPVLAVGRALRRGRVLVVAYHNVVPDDWAGTGDTSLHLRLSRFVGEIDRLRQTHDVVPLSEATEPARPGARPRAVVTFDDAYRGAVTLA